MRGLAHSLGQSGRRAGRSHNHLQFVGMIRMLFERKIKRRSRRGGRGVLPDVAHHTHNRHRLQGCLIEAADDLVAQRVFLAERLAGQRLADNRDTRCAVPVTRMERPPAYQRHSQGREIFGTAQGKVRFRQFLSGGEDLPAHHGIRAVRAISAGGQAHSGPGRFHSGQAGQFRKQPVNHRLRGPDVLVFGAAGAWAYMTRIRSAAEAHLSRIEGEETPEEKTCARGEHKGESDFSHHQRISQTVGTALEHAAPAETRFGSPATPGSRRTTAPKPEITQKQTPVPGS